MSTVIGYIPSTKDSGSKKPAQKEEKKETKQKASE